MKHSSVVYCTKLHRVFCGIATYCPRVCKIGERDVNGVAQHVATKRLNTRYVGH